MSNDADKQNQSDVVEKTKHLSLPISKGELILYLIMGSVAAFGIFLVIFFWQAWQGRPANRVSVPSFFSVGGKAIPSRVLVINSRKLVQLADVKIMSDKTMTPEKAKQAGEDFGNRLNGILKKYQDAGVTVISSGVALTYPSTADITKEVAAELGVSLD